MTPENTKICKAFHEKMIWTRFGMIVLGLWLLASPETFGYKSAAASWSDWISGILLIAIGFVSMGFRPRAWIWGACLIGVWLQFAPLVFWAKEPVVYVNDTLIGVLAIAFCILVPLRPKEMEVGPQIPPGWTYNPSSWHQRIPIIFFGMVGWFIARYLAAYQLGYIDTVWEPLGGTEKVITSMIAKDFPVPDAGLGALAYSLEALMGAKGGVRRWHTMPWIVVIFGILVVPLGFTSIVLVMLQPIAVGAWCGLCLLIAACMLVMLALTVDEVVAVCQYLHRSKREGKKFWHVFWRGSEHADDSVDTRTPTFHDPFWRTIKAMVLGVTIPWNLILTAILGGWLLFANEILGFSGLLAANTDVCGALIVVFSIISWAEVARPLRLLVVPLGIWFGIAWLILPGQTTDLIMWHSIVGGALAILLCLRRGRIKEKYGTWQKCIF